ncbi:hypothetical protein ADZ36_23590 [Streptomyces fradiae]|uniref:Uncharacterized protein n=2 Tax=Streptomyces TaxID=1883 RepID=A0A3R7HTT2_9ACTN|nr:hypothetical protein ADZ36_23590 [Streptomyces fradiae]OFA50962.1 hypothetical protein BEN35_15145 [Streptomyces fradiae]PQM19542.1 hypothetical protein Sfr7A_31730 [Streptomyces xinghaiensis]RKM90966.1 hypothetical protein SFRA_030525 [Streptomyces xinghaiensis]RNC68967.1 hypothetical protein DC095_030770 [Streptomyces xinghaiensis]
MWVPDDSANGPAGRQLRELTEPYLPYGVMQLIVETGLRSVASLHTLYGGVDGWDGRRRRLSFTALGTRHRVIVPVHRIVALTGDRERRARDTAPLWEAYTPPVPHRQY